MAQERAVILLKLGASAPFEEKNSSISRLNLSNKLSLFTFYPFNFGSESFAAMNGQ